MKINQINSRLTKGDSYFETKKSISNCQLFNFSMLLKILKDSQTNKKKIHPSICRTVYFGVTLFILLFLREKNRINSVLQLSSGLLFSFSCPKNYSVKIFWISSYEILRKAIQIYLLLFFVNPTTESS